MIFFFFFFFYYEAGRDKKKKRREGENLSEDGVTLLSREPPSLFAPSLFCVFCCIADVVKGLHLKVTHARTHTHSDSHTHA